MPDEDYHLQRYHAHKKWRRYHGLLLLVSILTGIGILIAPLFGIRGYQHASKASEHRDEADREMLPDSATGEAFIPCPDCGEPIELEAVDCLHCDSTRWTKDRRDDYLVFWLPALSVSAGIVVGLSLGTTMISFTLMVAVIIAVYVGGYRHINSKYQNELERLSQYASDDG